MFLCCCRLQPCFFFFFFYEQSYSRKSNRTWLRMHISFIKNKVTKYINIHCRIDENIKTLLEMKLPIIILLWSCQNHFHSNLIVLYCIEIDAKSNKLYRTHQSSYLEMKNYLLKRVSQFLQISEMLELHFNEIDITNHIKLFHDYQNDLFVS